MSADLPNTKPLFFAKITFLREHSLAPRQRSCNIDPPGLSRYYDYTSTVQTKCQKTFAKLDLQLSAELPNTKLLFFAKITFSREHSLAPRRRNFRFDSSIGVRTGGGGFGGQTFPPLKILKEKKTFCLGTNRVFSYRDSQGWKYRLEIDNRYRYSLLLRTFFFSFSIGAFPYLFAWYIDIN